MSLESANNTVRTHFRPKTFPKRALYIQPEDVAGEADVFCLGLGDMEAFGEEIALARDVLRIHCGDYMLDTGAFGQVDGPADENALETSAAIFIVHRHGVECDTSEGLR